VTQSSSDRYRNWLYVLLLLSGCLGYTTPDSDAALNPAINEVVEPRIEAFLQKMVDEEHFSGVALVVKGGDVIHAKGYGIAAEDAPNNVHTAFHVASVTTVAGTVNR
jgi:CubicO group peptidase (beta-lactamase class C family)